jgi:hypothetical protein
MSIGIVDVSPGANHSASGIVGVGIGDCGAIGGVVSLMPAASRGGLGDGGGEINGDGNTCGDGVTLGIGAGAGVAACVGDAVGAMDGAVDAGAVPDCDAVGETAGDVDDAGEAEAGDALAAGATVAVGDADGGGSGVVVATGTGCGVVVGDGAALGCGIALVATKAPAFAALAHRKMMPAQTRLRGFTRRAFAPRRAAALLRAGRALERLVRPDRDASELAGRRDLWSAAAKRHGKRMTVEDAHVAPFAAERVHNGSRFALRVDVRGGFRR